jgi:hypothetical protein
MVFAFRAISLVSREIMFSTAPSPASFSRQQSVITDNAITEAAIGVLKETGASGNIIAGNRFFRTPVPVQDPQSSDIAKLISPMR